MLNVLHVIPALAPRYGGPSTATIGMCRALRGSGVSTLIATTDADGPGRLQVELNRVQTYADVPAIFFRRRLSESFKWSGTLGSWLLVHVAQFDVVHVHAVFSHSSLAAGRACLQRGVPYIVRPLGTLDPWSVNRKRLRKQVLFRLGVKDLLKGAALIHYTSREEMRLAETVVESAARGVVVPLGIDEELFAAPATARSPTAGPYVLALSRVDAKKGLEVLIQAFHALAPDRQCEQWKLMIAGDGDPAYVSSLKALAEAGDARSRITFCGWMGGDEKLALVRGASLFASPSHQENFGISIVEALAAGVPALVTPGVNLAREIEAAGAGWSVERGDAAFTEALRSAMLDRPELNRRGQRARSFARSFSWAAVAASMVSMYEDACRRPAASAAIGR